MSDGVVKTPEQILDELGITSPEDLDIEAIAYHCGATICYEPLSGCEANIIGRKDRAIIAVNSDAIPTRRRFSAGHELGHWMRDRERIAFGCTQKDLDSQWTATEGSTNNPETRANQFASDLLLPNRLFVPMAKDRPITLDTVCDTASTFQMSKTATAIKLVRYGSFPAMVIYYEGGKRKWFIRPKGVPNALFPAARPDEKTLTGLLFDDATAEDGTEETRADYWFEHPKANGYYLRESCFRTSEDSIVTLLWWDDEKQIIDLEEEEERNAGRRSDERWRRR